MPKPILKERAFSDLNGLTQKMHMAIKYIFVGRGSSEIARRLDVHSSTISSWRKHPLVIAQIEKMNRESYKTTMEMQTELQRSAAPKAVQVVQEILDSPVDKDFNPANVRANTAVKVLQMTNVDMSNNPPEREQKAGDKVMDELQSNVAQAKREGLMVEVVIEDAEVSEE